MVELGNGIGYSGKVIAKLTNSNNIPVHLKNSGKKALWDTLAAAITGYDISQDCPYAFMVAVAGTSTDNYERDFRLNRKIQFLGKVWGNIVSTDEYSTSARFTATVTVKDKLSGIGSGETAVLLMYAKSGKLLAVVEDNDERDIARVHNSMIRGVDAVYEWILTFKNVSTPSADAESD